MNHLYFGDCLEVLKELSATQEPFIDLIYIDPPFNSKRNYNVLFESIAFNDANAQKQAFADTWSNVVYIVELQELAHLNKDLYDILSLFDKSKCVNDSAVAYLTTMAVRIFYMHRLLKKSGSFYLHCDPTMSHYLKLICDIVFGEKNFRSEISWKRTNAHNNAKQGRKAYEGVRDVIFFYSKSDSWTWNQLYTPYDQHYIDSSYRMIDPSNGRRYQAVDLTAAKGGGDTSYDWKGYKLKSGRYWAYSKENMQKFDDEGRLYYTSSGLPRLKYYLDEMPGKALQNDFPDILPAKAVERLGYPTQKPEALLERIITASTNEGDVVADFFCGCGTTVAAAQKLKRQWLGVDISHLAIKLILKRLQDRHGKAVRDNVKVHGFPKDVASAKMLATETENGRLGFQEWVIEVLLHGVANTKKTADGGFDGYLTYNTDTGKEFALIETKSGNVNVKNIREFIQVIDKQKAAAGIFVCFKNTVTKEMLKEAKAAGSIAIAGVETNIDRIQILTIDELLNDGKQPSLPNVSSTFKKSEKVVQARTAYLFE